MPATTAKKPSMPAPESVRPTFYVGKEPTRVAVVGAGYIADYHLGILAAMPEVELRCICDLDERRARQARERWGAAEVATDFDELVRYGVQVAHVLVPPEHHARVARELLERNIGVFVEKPFALSSADGRELVKLANERGLPLGVNHNACFHPAFVKLLAAVRSGSIGRVEHVQATLSVPLRQLDAGDVSHWMFRAPKNIVFEQAPHPFSQLVELVGDVREMSARVLGTRELGPGLPFHDRWLLAATAERGTAEVYLAFGQGFTRNTIQVIGSDGCVEADLHHDLVTRETKTQWLDFWNGFLAGWRRGGQLRRRSLRNLFHYGRQTLGLGGREDAFWAGMRDSIRAFHTSLRAGAPVAMDGRHGVAVLEWCEAAVKGVKEPKAMKPLEAASQPARTGEVCVLGASGFIGRHTLAALLERELPVTAVGRRPHGLPTEISDGVRSGAVRLKFADLTDAEALDDAIAGARVVVHLATGGGDDWTSIERAMVHGTRKVAEACLVHGVERLIYVSSTAALYLGRDVGNDVLLDDVAADPEPERRALYARGKIAAEQELLRLHAERNLPVTIVRPAVVVGPGTPLQHSGLGLWARDNHCVGWGLGTRPVPLVLVSDVADALARLVAFEGKSLNGRTLNLASRSKLTAPEVVAAYARGTGRDLRFHPRPLRVSQAMEIGKWIVKRVGGRKDAPFPSFRDLKSRELYPELRCHTAREILGWTPCDDGEAIVRAVLGTDGAEGN